MLERSVKRRKKTSLKIIALTSSSIGGTVQACYRWSVGRALTVHVPVVRHGVDLLAGQHLHVLPAGAAVELVGPNQPAAHAVRHLALLAHMLREIRRGLIGYLSKIKRHYNQYLTQCM